VAERSDGNPLFIEELLRSWISAGTLVADDGATGDGGWRLAVAPDAVLLPATVQAIYAAQLDDLPAHARLVARRASVAGRRFAVGALEPLEVPDPEGGLEPLRQRAFIRGPERDPAGDEVYAYRHALLRDAGYASLSRAERGRLHLALATWLEQTAGSDVARVAEPIASHYESALAALPAVGTDAADRARLADAARVWLERAADAALGVAAHEAAIGLLARAIALADGEREQARLRLRRGELMAATGDLGQGIGEIEAALAVFRDAFRADPKDREARAGYGNATAALGEGMIEQIRFIEARDLVSATLADIGRTEDALVGRLLALRAWAMVSQGDRDGTVADVERALELVRGGDPRLEVEVRQRRASVRTEGELDVLAEWDEVEEMARSVGMWSVAVRALDMRIGNDPQASLRDILAAVESALDLAVTHGLTEVACGTRTLVVATKLGLGEWDEALAMGLENLPVAERNAYVRPVFRTWVALVPILEARREREHLARFAEWFGSARSTFPEPPSAYAQVHLAGLDLALATVGLPPVRGASIGIDVLAADAYVNFDYLAAVESTMRDWLVRGLTDDAVAALGRIEVRYREDDAGRSPTAFIEAFLGLLHAWVLRARESADTAGAARAAADWGRRAEAPWWVARAIRALPEGAARPEELAEAGDIEARLRVVPGASAPPR
jgi:tetratricopeptide (TPR) repeat protein